MKSTGILALVLLPMLAFGQYKVDDGSSSLVIEGTSSLHDWEIEAEEIKGTATLDPSSLDKLSNLKFSVVVKELKSGKGAMDKNTYEALKEDDHPEVTYTLTKVNNITPAGSGKYKLSTSGNLTIAGTTKPVNMEVTATTSAGGVVFSGEYPLKMTTFNVDPPTAVFGTIKTGDEVTIKFNVNYKKS
jgi:polyisoprenoid-binding protein YceI